MSDYPPYGSGQRNYDDRRYRPYQEGDNSDREGYEGGYRGSHSSRQLSRRAYREDAEGDHLERSSRNSRRESGGSERSQPYRPGPPSTRRSSGRNYRDNRRDLSPVTAMSSMSLNDRGDNRYYDNPVLPGDSISCVGSVRSDASSRRSRRSDDRRALVPFPERPREQMTMSSLGRRGQAPPGPRALRRTPAPTFLEDPSTLSSQPFPPDYDDRELRPPSPACTCTGSNVPHDRYHCISARGKRVVDQLRKETHSSQRPQGDYDYLPETARRETATHVTAQTDRLSVNNFNIYAQTVNFPGDEPPSRPF